MLENIEPRPAILQCIITGELDRMIKLRDKHEIGSTPWRMYQREVEKLEEHRRLIAG